MPPEDKKRIRPNGGELYFVHCPNCDNVVGETRPHQGMLNRYLCRHCKQWVILVGVGTRRDSRSEP